jgi:hypothetical protein
MAENPHNRVRFTSDPQLVLAASTVPLHPDRDKAVFYAEDEGARLSEAFISSNPGHVRLDELLKGSSGGQSLLKVLMTTMRPWSELEEVWWELSWRLARAASGVVNVFGPKRLNEDRPLSEFEHKYTTGSYANTVFEKVELPELAANQRVTRILYNGQPFS